MSGETPNLPAFSLRDPTTGSLSLQPGSTNLLKFICRLLFYDHIRFIYLLLFLLLFHLCFKDSEFDSGVYNGENNRARRTGIWCLLLFLFLFFPLYLLVIWVEHIVVFSFYLTSYPLFIEISGLANLFSKYLLSTFLYASLHTSVHSLVSIYIINWTCASHGPCVTPYIRNSQHVIAYPCHSFLLLDAFFPSLLCFVHQLGVQLSPVTPFPCLFAC